MAKETNTNERELASITRDIYKDQIDQMKKIAKDTGVSVAHQIRAALDYHLPGPLKKRYRR